MFSIICLVVLHDLPVLVGWFFHRVLAQRGLQIILFLVLLLVGLDLFPVRFEVRLDLWHEEVLCLSDEQARTVVVCFQRLPDLLLLVVGDPGVAVLVKLCGMAACFYGLYSLQVDELAEVLAEQVGRVQVAAM